MIIAEATAVNRVLRYFLEVDQDDDPKKAREACEYLADRADKALHAGIRSADVIAAWPLEGDTDTEEVDLVGALLASVEAAKKRREDKS